VLLPALFAKPDIICYQESAHLVPLLEVAMPLPQQELPDVQLVHSLQLLQQSFALLAQLPPSESLLQVAQLLLLVAEPLQLEPLGLYQDQLSQLQDH
jgi:hypothetical protein